VTPADLTSAIHGIYDFVLFTPNLLECIQDHGVRFQLFANTRSFGEIPHTTIKHYANILCQMDIDNMFLENRFLNTFNPLVKQLTGFRSGEEYGSTWVPKEWDLVDSVLEPDWCRSPYEGTHPRYLALALKGISGYSKYINNIDPDEFILSVKLEDWFLQSRAYSKHNLIDAPISFYNQTLAGLFDLVRRDHNSDVAFLMLRLIEFHFGNKHIEEWGFYRSIYESGSGKKYKMPSIFSMLITKVNKGFCVIKNLLS